MDARSGISATLSGLPGRGGATPERAGRTIAIFLQY
jgi:hypothetical protein